MTSKTGGGKGTNQHAVRGASSTKKRTKAVGPETLFDKSSEGLTLPADIINHIAQLMKTQPQGQKDWAFTQPKREKNLRPDMPSELLSILATNSAAHVRVYVAMHPNTEISVLSQLATDRSVYVAIALADNHNTPAEVLTKLSEHADERVRGGVAAHPGTPVNVLKQLAKDRNGIVRYNVANNPNTPSAILGRLPKAEDNTHS